jgi:hypothetical protein
MVSRDEEDLPMNPRIVWIAGASIAIAILGGGVALAGDSDTDDESLTEPALSRATASALEHAAGSVTETEVGDDGAAYGVEMRLADGSEVEIALDKNFTVIGEERDDSDGDEQEGDGIDDRDDGRNDRDKAGDDD